MIVARPRGVLTSGFDLVDDAGAVLASLEGSWWREGGTVRSGAGTWEVRRDGWAGFRLLRGEDAEATARSLGMFRTSLEVQHQGRTYLLKRPSAFRRPYAVWEAGTQVGSVAPTSAFSNAAAVDLPASMPVHVQVFVVAVVVTQWRRQQSAAASAST
jgi:hypothetical protein